MSWIKIGDASRFAAMKFWPGPCEADFLPDENFGWRVPHAQQGPYGMDMVVTPAAEALPRTGPPALRTPQETILRYPYCFRSSYGKTYMTGARGADSGHSWIYEEPGNGDYRWYAQNGVDPILYENADPESAWHNIYNVPMVDIPDVNSGVSGARRWLAAPELTGGTGLALSSIFTNPFAPGFQTLEAGKSPGIVIGHGSGNGYFDNYQDEYCILWSGVRDNEAVFGTSFWYLSFFYAKFAHIIADHKNPAIWTLASDKFALGWKDKHVCDPCVARTGDRSILMCSFDQGGMWFFQGPNLDRIYERAIFGA